MPLIDHPAESFLAKLEDGLLNLVKSGTVVSVVSACVQCAAAIIHGKKRSNKNVWKVFSRFYGRILRNVRANLSENQRFLSVMFGWLGYLLKTKEDMRSVPVDDQMNFVNERRSNLLRSLYVVGVMCRYQLSPLCLV